MDDDSHCFDNFNFSHPKAHAKALRTNLHEFLLASVQHNLQIDVLALIVENQASNVAEMVHHVIVVQKNDIDVQ